MISSVDAQALLSGVDVVEAGDGPVAVLSHGAGGGVRENFAALLGVGGRRWVGPYLPGAGASPCSPQPLDIDVLADRLVAAGVAAGAERFPILGFSLGAAVAVTAAVRHPEHVSALVLTNGVLYPDAQVRSVVTTWRALAAASDADALAAFLVLVAGGADELAALSDDDWPRAVTLTRRGHPPGGADHAELVARTDVRPLLSQVGVPTLVVVGGQDRIVLPTTSRGFAAIPGAELLDLSAAGHVLTGEPEQVWTRHVLAFLDRV